MGTSFRCNDFRDRLGGQALLMIGGWYSRQPLTNHKQPLPTQMIPQLVALKAHTQSPNSFWSGEIRDITLDLAVKMEGELIKCLKLLP